MLRSYMGVSRLQNASLNVEVLTVAGGAGGAGGTYSGGGGAGGYLEGTMVLSSAGYPVVIGAGGSGGGAAGASIALNGNNSTFNSATAIGGGRGGRYQVVPDESGASGGVEVEEVQISDLLALRHKEIVLD